VLNGEPSAINLLDALNAWQLVRQLDHAFGVAAAASFKHVSPAGAAIGLAVDEATAATYDVDPTGLTELATAYVRARQTDPKSSYGDVAALSRPVDLAVAQQLAGVVSDAVIAPGYTPEALEVLCRKKRGAYLIVEIDADFQLPAQEHREIYGVRLALQRDRRSLDLSDVDNVVCGELGEPARRDALVAMIVARYTQSNSVVYTHQPRLFVLELTRSGGHLTVGDGEVPGREPPDGHETAVSGGVSRRDRAAGAGRADS